VFVVAYLVVHSDFSDTEADVTHFSNSMDSHSGGMCVCWHVFVIDPT
jgi:hypothetical protein